MIEIQESTWSFSNRATPVYQVLHAMEQTARLHTVSLGISREEMLCKYGAVWMIARAWLHFDALLDKAQPLTIRTWHRGLSRGVIYRDFDLMQNGVRIGEAVQTWVLVEAESRRLFRMDRAPELVHTAVPPVTKTLRPGKPVPSAPLLEISPLCPGTETVDENGHINNAAYVELVLQGLPFANIQTLELNYHQECFAGQCLPRLQWQDEHSAFVRLLTPDGLTAFDLKAATY